MSSLQIKLLALILFINAVVTIFLHKSERLVIYRDYTDAAFTGLAPFAAIIFYYMLAFFEFPNTIAKVLAFIIFSILMVFVVVSTVRSNNGISLFFVMSLITKLTIVGLYYALMAWLLYSSGSARNKGESYAAYEARKRREAKGSAAALSATTVGFIALSAWVCKDSEFSSIDKYLSINSTT